MGTNYYLHEQPDCPTCGRPHERKHIGKSSAGWCFSLHVEPDEGINSLADWVARWSVPGAIIRDEYGRDVTAEQMLANITKRSWNKPQGQSPEWHHMNHSEDGPNGLARHRIDGRHCIAHGDGTYDLMIGGDLSDTSW